VQMVARRQHFGHHIGSVDRHGLTFRHLQIVRCAADCCTCRPVVQPYKMALERQRRRPLSQAGVAA
jgi:hypothetical protein